MTVNANGDVYITGRAEREVLSGNYDIYTAKLSSLGDLIWQRFYNGPANGHDVPCGLILGDQGHLYVAGTSQDTNGVNEPVVLMYSPQGELVAEKRCGDSNGTIPQECTSVVSGFNNSIILITTIPTTTPGQNQIVLTKYAPAYAFTDRVYSQKPGLIGTGPANSTYRIQKLNNFQSWEDVDTVTANSIGCFTWEMPIPQGPGQGFYRWITP
jgi:hypothetical protein